MIKNSLAIILCLFVISCASYSTLPLMEEIPSNELPMYGGVEFTPQQKEANEWFINTVTKRAGSKEKASEEIAKLGWESFYKRKPRTAMKRFNQAWLLNPENPHVYWGFGVLLGDEGKTDEATEMLEKALSLDPSNTRLLGDVANSYKEKARTISKASKNDQEIFFKKAEKLFLRAEAQKPDSCTYAQWAVLSYHQGDYEKCLEKITKASKYPKKRECGFVDEYEQRCREALK